MLLAYVLPEEPILERLALGWVFMGPKGIQAGGTLRTIAVPTPKKSGEILALIFPVTTQNLVTHTRRIRPPPRALSSLSEHFPEKSEVVYYVQSHSPLLEGPLVPLRHFDPYRSRCFSSSTQKPCGTCWCHKQDPQCQQFLPEHPRDVFGDSLFLSPLLDGEEVPQRLRHIPGSCTVTDNLLRAPKSVNLAPRLPSRTCLGTSRAPAQPISTQLRSAARSALLPFPETNLISFISSFFLYTALCTISE